MKIHVKSFAYFRDILGKDLYVDLEQGSTVEDFFEIVSRRYEKGSIIITSNRPIHEWDKVFIDKTLTGAVVDRLLHHSHVIEIVGDSYRFKKRD